MSGIAGRLHLPRVAHGPLSSAPKWADGPDEDWGEIEALLSSPTPAREAARSRSRRRHIVSVFASSVAATLVFAGMLTAGLWGLQEGCDARATGCAMPTTQAVAATGAPPSSSRQPTPTDRVADADAAQRASRREHLAAVRNEGGLAEGRSSVVDAGGANDDPAEVRQQAVASPSASLVPGAAGIAEPRTWHSYDRHHHARAHGRHRYAWWR